MSDLLGNCSHPHMRPPTKGRLQRSSRVRRSRCLHRRVHWLWKCAFLVPFHFPSWQSSRTGAPAPPSWSVMVGWSIPERQGCPGPGAGAVWPGHHRRRGLPQSRGEHRTVRAVPTQKWGQLSAQSAWETQLGDARTCELRLSHRRVVNRTEWEGGQDTRRKAHMRNSVQVTNLAHSVCISVSKTNPAPKFHSTAWQIPKNKISVLTYILKSVFSFKEKSTINKLQYSEFAWTHFVSVFQPLSQIKQRKNCTLLTW